MVGVFLAAYHDGWSYAPSIGREAVALSLCGLLLFVSGNFLNDWKDRVWDATHRPERALPLGLFPAAAYLAFASACGIIALWLARTIHTSSLWIASAILVCILIYTWLHKKTPWAVIPMGLCRAMLPTLGFTGIAAPLSPATLPPVLILCAAGLFCHIAGLSLNARRESTNPQPRRDWGLPSLCFLAASVSMWFAASHYLSLPPGACLFGLVPYAGWTCFLLAKRSLSIGARVSGMLAGIPLVDGMVLLPLAISRSTEIQTPPLAMAILMFTLPPATFVLAKLLQRFTPAT